MSRGSGRSFSICSDLQISFSSASVKTRLRSLAARKISSTRWSAGSRPGAVADPLAGAEGGGVDTVHARGDGGDGVDEPQPAVVVPVPVGRPQYFQRSFVLQ